jgi:predicted DNA-binding ribbon-helix-helix protein
MAQEVAAVMRTRATEAPNGIDRVQTGVRMEKRLVKVCKAVAELRDISLGELLETMVNDGFAGQPSFDDAFLVKVHELMAIYGLERRQGKPRC